MWSTQAIVRKENKTLVPTRRWAFDLIRDKGMPHHIFCHSMMVRRVAILIAYSVKEQGHSIGMQLVDRAAILHDICKIDTIQSGGDHALLGQQLLDNYGYGVVGDVVGQHVRLNSMDLNEAMIVNYADKRVMHNRVVSLSKRFLDLMDRYGTDEDRVRRILDHYNNSVQTQDIISVSSGMDPGWLNNLSLIPCDYPLYAGDGFLGEYCPVEQ